jgi:ribonucleotide reductase alpha subunit
MEGFDAWALASPSQEAGTRRAAKMVTLNIDHPDIYEQRNGKPGFITCKSDAEQLAHDLYSTGKYTAEFNVPGNVYDRVHFQNANNSVRVTDDFMLAVEQDRNWTTTREVKSLKNGKPDQDLQGSFLWKEIAKAAWMCGDPGIQFDTSTNEWHTCKASGRINASNPCSEYLFLDDTACNLSSLNLQKFANGKELRHPGLHPRLRSSRSRRRRSSSMPARTRSERSLVGTATSTGRWGSATRTSELAADATGASPTTRTRVAAVAGAITAIMTGAAYTDSRRTPGSRPRDRSPSTRARTRNVDA